MIIVAFILFMDLLTESLKLGIIPSLVVAIYLLLNKIIENKKESKQLKLSQDIINGFSKLNNFLTYMTEDLIAKEADRRDLAIKNSFDRFENEIIKFGIYTIINNNIDINKENILDNAKHMVLSEYYALQSALTLYSPDKVNLSECINKSWQDELYGDIIAIIFKEGFTKEQKIYNLYNKINLRINEYKSVILKHHFDNN